MSLLHGAISVLCTSADPCGSAVPQGSTPAAAVRRSAVIDMTNDFPVYVSSGTFPADFCWPVMHYWPGANE